MQLNPQPAVARERKVADQLAAMANEIGVITYTPTYRTHRVFISSHFTMVWHEMDATTEDGRTWKYWLARDWGSYRGTFFDGP